MTICVEIIKSECYNYLNYNFFSKPLNKTIIKDCLSESTLHLQRQPRGYLGRSFNKITFTLLCYFENDHVCLFHDKTSLVSIQISLEVNKYLAFC